jgi:hypothetical protein
MHSDILLRPQHRPRFRATWRYGCYRRYSLNHASLRLKQGKFAFEGAMAGTRSAWAACAILTVHRKILLPPIDARLYPDPVKTQLRCQHESQRPGPF